MYSRSYQTRSAQPCVCVCQAGQKTHRHGHDWNKYTDVAACTL